MRYLCIIAIETELLDGYALNQSMHMDKDKMQNIFKIGLLFILLVSAFSFAQEMPYLKITVEDSDNASQVVLESSQRLSTSVEKSGQYLMVRIRADRPYRIQRQSFRSRFIDSLGWSRGSDYYQLNIKTNLPEFNFLSSTLQNPPRLIIDILPAGGEPQPETRFTTARTETEEKTDTTPVLAEPGIKTIVIDPGHGGLEVGAKGKFGTLEKEVTLGISLKLKSIIERNQAFRVVMTRDKDVDVSLDSRSAIANNNRSYVFVSIHANGFFSKSARGSETYFLNLNATDEEARRIAYMENNASEMDQIEGENEDDIRMILWDMAQSAYLTQSSRLAELIQNELNTLLGTKNRGVKQAPFKVLTGVACPAVLVEVAFISNPDEERKLLSDDFQARIAQAIYSGLAKFIRMYSQG